MIHAENKHAPMGSDEVAPVFLPAGALTKISQQPQVVGAEDVAPVFFSTGAVARILGCSMKQVYRLLDAGAIESVYLGSRRCVVAESLDTFIRKLPTQRA